MSLRIQDLRKTYSNGVVAIDHLNLEIRKGMFGLLGPNGAGKSSLMRTIATLQQPDEGAIGFKDFSILDHPMKLRKLLGYLPQSFGVYQKVSAEKLLDYFAILKGIASKKERNLIVAKVLELTNLYDDRKKHVSGYSGGMKQRFGIAQLLLNNPELIIVDEPTAGLDPAERNRFLNVLREVGAENTVIFSTHIVEDVKELCTDMAIMNHGKILQKTNPSEATNAIKNQIWSISIAKERLPEMMDKYNVLSSNYNEDNSLRIRIHALEKPSEKFEAVDPNLEDVYFIALQKSNQ
ncbi:ABC transporter ATP-binding protein [Aquimarina litoralis]|uniref:ABC transporter ATP-binding protein n=1 Tax=Aquimarina litoralis TaxID=584605 RepID=UPI001C56942E|nr:ABC transporter ATP-binding protein [Aquimarina litoralis]MBW1299067.1 ATP-binding cassette domain-containing protein [Aquimarina litoralis]